MDRSDGQLVAPAGLVPRSSGEVRRGWEGVGIASTGARAALVGLLGLTLGVLTAYGQAWLPQELGSLANSSGSWASLAFLLALFGTNHRIAGMLGFLAFITLLGEYVLGAEFRGDPSSSSLIAFWGLAAVVAGPVLGLGAHWLKTDRGYLAAVGIGVMCGVLIGEGVYGLTFIADTTYPPYWWGEIAVGVVLLGYVAARRLGELKPAAVAVVCSLIVAAAFLGIYSQELISFFP